MKAIALAPVSGFGRVARPPRARVPDIALEIVFGLPAKGESRDHWRDRVRRKYRNLVRYVRRHRQPMPEALRA